jgi:hypothetical protein
MLIPELHAFTTSLLNQQCPCQAHPPMQFTQKCSPPPQQPTCPYQLPSYSAAVLSKAARQLCSAKQLQVQLTSNSTNASAARRQNVKHCSAKTPSTAQVVCHVHAHQRDKKTITPQTMRTIHHSKCSSAHEHSLWQQPNNVQWQVAEAKGCKSTAVCSSIQRSTPWLLCSRQQQL